jgi:hypothetical protein
MFTDCRCVDIIIAGTEREGQNVYMCVCVLGCGSLCGWVSGWVGDCVMKVERTRLLSTDTYLKFQVHMSISYCDLKVSGKIQ